MGIDLRQRRLVVLIILSTLFVSAAFVASGTTRLVASAVLPLDAAVAQATATARPARDGDTAPRKDATAILHRNIFDSAQGPLDVDPPAAGEGAPGGEGEEPGDEPVVETLDPSRPPPRCEGTLRLVGSFYMRLRPENSLAAITNAAGKVLLYRENSTIDDKTVYAIGSNEIYLRASSGSLCSLAMFSPAEAAGEAPAAAAPVVVAEAAPASEGDGALSAAELDQGIQRVSDTQYNVSRSLLNKVLENQAALMSQARVVPQEEGGRTTGVKVYGIRRNSLLSRLGVQNGDVLRTINGYNLTSPDSALEAYTRLRSAEQLTIQMMRRGTPTNVNYSIR